MKGEVMQWEKAGGSDAPKGKGGKKRGILIGVAVVVLLVVLVRMVGCGGSRADSISWPSSGLATMLPEPKSPKGTLWENSDKEFRVSLEELDAKMQSEYIESCKEKGFTVDAVSETSFMVEYANSGNAASMALDYAKWVARYGEMTSKASEVDDSQLSAEDAQYFLEAQTRVNQRLLEIA